MKALRIIAKIVGYFSVAVAAVMAVIGEFRACVSLLIAGLLVLWIASHVFVDRPTAAEAQHPEEEMTEEEKAARDKRIADAQAKGVACCPYCGSTSILVAYGRIDGRVKRCTCVSCGREFLPGQKP